MSDYKTHEKMQRDNIIDRLKTLVRDFDELDDYVGSSESTLRTFVAKLKELVKEMDGELVKMGASEGDSNV